MKYIRFLTDLLRAREWLVSRILFNLSILFCFLLISNKSIIDEAAILLPILIYILSIGSFGYLFNDIFDQKNDKIAGRSNFSSALSPFLIVFIIAVLLIIGTVPFLFLLKNYHTYYILLGIQLLLFVLYSLPWIRLKETSSGVFCDALYSYVFPGIIVLSIAIVNLEIDTHLSLEFVLLLTWLILLGFRSIVFHQISDLENDLMANQKTFAVRVSKEKSVQLLKGTAIIELVLFVILVFLLNPLYPVFVISFILLLVLGSVKIYQKTVNIKSLFEALNSYYDYYIFMSILLYFAWIYHPLFAIVPVIYVSVQLNLFSWLYYKPILWFYYKAKGAIRRMKK
jgi:4-hydroxybenzoate polyprenyltransferase